MSLDYLWMWFCELQSAADTPFSWQEVYAWARLTGQDPSPQEATFLRELSLLYVSTLTAED